MIRELIQELNFTYDQKRLEASKKKKEMQLSLEKKYPYIREYKNKRDFLAYNAQDAILQNPEDYQVIIEEIEREFEKMDALLEEYLEKENIQDLYRAEYYDCPHCQDTGYLQSQRCHCFKQALAKLVFSQSDTPLHGTVNLNTYSLDVFQDPSQRKQMEKNLSIVKDYAKNFSANTTKGFLFQGSPGLGKTYLLSALSNELMEKGFLVVYQTAPKLLESLRTYSFQQRPEFNELLEKSDLLIIDDLGKELSSPYQLSEMYSLLNTRYLSQKPIALSTNLTPEELQRVYERPLFSRLLQMCDFIRFTGNDLRFIHR